VAGHVSSIAYAYPLFPNKQVKKTFVVNLRTHHSIRAATLRLKVSLHLNILINSESGMVEVGYESTEYECLVPVIDWRAVHVHLLCT